MKNGFIFWCRKSSSKLLNAFSIFFKNDFVWERFIVKLKYKGKNQILRCSSCGFKVGFRLRISSKATLRVAALEAFAVQVLIKQMLERFVHQKIRNHCVSFRPYCYFSSLLSVFMIGNFFSSCQGIFAQYLKQASIEFWRKMVIL